MHRGWLIVGLVVTLVGALLWYLPLPTSVGSGAVPPGEELVVTAGAPFAVFTPQLAYTASFASGSGLPLNVTVYACGTNSTCSAYTKSDVLTSATGTSGTLRWTGGKDRYFAIVPSGTSAAATISVQVGLPFRNGLVGLGLVGIGIVLIALGAASGARRTPPPPPKPSTAPPTRGNVGGARKGAVGGGSKP